MQQPTPELWDKVPGYSSDDEDSFSSPEPMKHQLESRLTEVLSCLSSRCMESPTIQFQPVPLQGSKAASKKASGSSCPPPAFLLNAEAPILQETFQHNGMIPTLCSDYVIQWSGPNIRDAVYQSMMEWQRINHFPGSTELTRKDRLWMHFAQMAKSYGKGCFDFVPETYVLPDQFDSFLTCYQRSRCTWIVKPNASSRGRGIFLLSDLSELPLDETVVVSRYIDDPLLIQGFKFDLRVYVLVTSYDPLKAYIYREGLTRFASAPYSTKGEHIQDAFRHLTNYSINKNSESFVENSDMRADNVGHKWSLSALNKHLRCVGVDVNLMWARINDLIVKTLLSVEPSISSRTRQVTGSRENCFELYGFDVLVDNDLKPWLLEVNLSPSMQAESPLDWQIKSSLLADTFNIVGVCSNERPAPKPNDRMRASYSQPWKAAASPKKEDFPVDETHAPLVLNVLSDANLKMLAKAVGERSRCRNFVPLYPTRAAVKRYGIITEARAQQLAVPRMGPLTGANRCVSQSQMLASMLYGPFPRRSAIEVRNVGAPLEVSSQILDENLAETPENRDTSPVSLVPDLDSVLQASSPISFKEPWPAFFAKPLPKVVDPALSFEDRQTALGLAQRALRAISGVRRPSQESEDSEGKASHDEDEDSAGRGSGTGSRLLLMEYLIRMEATCDSLAPAGRARLVQGASYARLSKFQRHLPKVAARLAAVSNIQEHQAENGCLVEDMMAACRDSLDILERTWREEDDACQEIDLEVGSKPLTKRLPGSLLQDQQCRCLLKALPNLQVADLESLLRGHLPSVGDDAALRRMLECFREDSSERRSGSFHPSSVKETPHMYKSRSNILPQIRGEYTMRAMRNEGRLSPLGPLSEILSAAVATKETALQPGRRPHTLSRAARSPSGPRLRGVHAPLTWSKTTSHKPLADVLKEAKATMAGVMMPMPRLVPAASMRRSASKSRALPELPEVRGSDGVRADKEETPRMRVSQASATNLKFDIEL
ncbi:unnamed protein product [Effrenium voratum]|nr:unnamed protein product [Effrenium voratum]